jgi:hypothetical protein
MKTGTSGARGRAADTSGHSDANATANAAKRATVRRRNMAGILQREQRRRPFIPSRN